ncbi:NADH oxidase [Paraburkholderia sp. J12]|uniref:NADH oxidase n=1 Tax=Paraburkholderia sp. J12 TaxID=2805432 RepID=UPI002ABE3627|nr:NADH oxidase [Paraburkholderia sp. J12]
MHTIPASAQELRSLITPEGQLQLSLEEVAVPVPSAEEIVVQIQAAPVNPSDIISLLGPADLSTLEVSHTSRGAVTTATVPADKLPAVTARLGLSLPIGNEGAGLVVATGVGAHHLLGRTVALRSTTGTYAQYRLADPSSVMVLPVGMKAETGASAFINPLTALAMLQTMRTEGHRAIIHTAAASSLGQMLVKLCAADDIPLVNIVRNESQVRTLRDLGAQYVLDSSAADFDKALVDAIDATGATLAFDAIGGGDMAEKLLIAMDAVTVRNMPRYDRYGSSTHKQVYLYGTLDARPTTINRRFGMAWGVGGWLMTWRIQSFGAAIAASMRERVVSELSSTFASHYSERISLTQLIEPDTIRRFARRATGDKYLLEPNA